MSDEKSVRVSAEGSPRKRRCYVSSALEARSMLAIWLDDPPACSKDQRDPDGWTTGAADSDFLAKRLAELAHAPNVDVYRLHGASAEWWSRIESNRKRAASKKRNEEAAAAVIPLLQIPEAIEEEGRRIGYARAASRGRKR